MRMQLILVPGLFSSPSRPGYEAKPSLYVWEKNEIDTRDWSLTELHTSTSFLLKAAIEPSIH